MVRAINFLFLAPYPHLFYRKPTEKQKQPMSAFLPRHLLLPLSCRTRPDILLMVSVRVKPKISKAFIFIQFCLFSGKPVFSRENYFQQKLDERTVEGGTQSSRPRIVRQPRMTTGGWQCLGQSSQWFKRLAFRFRPLSLFWHQLVKQIKHKLFLEVNFLNLHLNQL